MHDPRVPASTPKLISEISSLISSVPSEIRRRLCEGFWETMAREWGGIDRARLDKYLSLIRKVLREEFEVVEQGRNEELVEQSMILESWPLCADQRKVPDGLRYQVLDCWEEELVASGLIQDVTENSDQLHEKKRFDNVKQLMKIVQGLRQKAMSKGIKARAKEVLEDEDLKLYVQDI
ncbi:MAG: hypothetical protein Q9160_000984 [Pyrenula sp. 1 TL-2023]